MSVRQSRPPPRPARQARTTPVPALDTKFVTSRHAWCSDPETPAIYWPHAWIAYMRCCEGGEGTACVVSRVTTKELVPPCRGLAAWAPLPRPCPCVWLLHG